MNEVLNNFALGATTVAILAFSVVVVRDIPRAMKKQEDRNREGHMHEIEHICNNGVVK